MNESGKTLEEIVKSVKQVIDMVAEIAAASREQTTGIDQVNMSVTQMDQVTQSNAAQTEELSGAATALSDKADHLRQLVAGFRLGAVGGSVFVRKLPAARRAQPRLVATAVAEPTRKAS